MIQDPRFMYNVAMKLNARELREVDDQDLLEKAKSLKKHDLYFILENVYDTYNVGGLFRLADALSVKKMYLCGQMEIPPNSKIKKASIGTYKIVPWEYKRTAADAIEALRNSATGPVSNSSPPVLKHEDQLRAVGAAPSSRHPSPFVIAIEQHEKAVDYAKADYSLPVAFVVGNETSGVTPETLKLVDQIVEIPMWGVNKSLNVIVSAAIVSYHAMLSIS